MLFTYGSTAPTVPKTTATRRIHHPSPGPQDQPVGGPAALADPQNPLIVNVPTSVVAAPGIATIGKKRATRATPRTIRLRMRRLSVGIARPYSSEKRARTTARTMRNTRSRRDAVARTLATARYEDRVELYGRISVPSHSAPRYRSGGEVVQQEELMSVSVPMLGRTTFMASWK